MRGPRTRRRAQRGRLSQSARARPVCGLVPARPRARCRPPLPRKTAGRARRAFARPTPPLLGWAASHGSNPYTNGVLLAVWGVRPFWSLGLARALSRGSPRSTHSLARSFPPRPPEKTKPNKKQRQDANACVCPPGQAVAADGKCRITDGNTCNANADCLSNLCTNNLCSSGCTPPKVLSSDGTSCVCKPGSYLTTGNTCVICGPGSTSTVPINGAARACRCSSPTGKSRRRVFFFWSLSGARGGGGGGARAPPPRCPLCRAHSLLPPLWGADGEKQGARRRARARAQRSLRPCARARFTHRFFTHRFFSALRSAPTKKKPTNQQTPKHHHRL